MALCVVALAVTAAPAQAVVAAGDASARDSTFALTQSASEADRLGYLVSGVPPQPSTRDRLERLLPYYYALLGALLVALAGHRWTRRRRAAPAPKRERKPRKPPAAARPAPHYLSADTTPQRYAVARRLVVAPTFLLLFAALCAAIVPALPALMSGYASLLATLSGVPPWQIEGKGGSLSFRPFLLALIVLLSVFAVGTPAQRLRLLASSIGLYTAAVVLVDVVLARAQGPLVPPFSQVGGIVAGLTGLLSIIVTIFLRYQMPAGIRVVRRRPVQPRVLVVLGLCGAVALTIVGAFSVARNRHFDDFHLRFIGGLDSELVLFLLGMVVLLAFASALDRSSKPTEGPWLSVAFLIPAFNEAHGIAATVHSLDVAAARYGMPCTLYAVDNGSWDDTVEQAQRALSECPNVKGRVLHCPIPGKSHALNFGLRHIAEDVVVRIDADTLVEPTLLENLMPWFWDPSVGGVGGLPLPKRNAPRWLYPLRIIEVYYGVIFLRVAQGAADAVMVMPGLIAAYRREVLEELGGFGEGFNGEDADVTMRIGRLGYRVVTDPSVRVYTEVPESLAQLREQRQRWSRGLYHMAGRNMSSIWMRQGPRAMWNLPWSIFNASRRSMMIPVLACALTVELLEPSVFSLREVSVVAGFLVGLQLIVISVLLVAHRKFRVLPFVPAYLLFRMVRAYIAFETVLTLRLKKPRDSTRRRRADAPAVASVRSGDGAAERPAVGLSPDRLAPLRAMLSEFADAMLAPIPQKDLRRWGEVYLRGLITEGPKSIEGLAGRLANGDARGLRRLIGRSPWPWQPVRARLAAKVAASIAPVAWIVDDLAMRPSGRRAVRVNAAAEAASCPVDWRLLLRGDRDGVARGSSAALPDDVGPGPAWRLALEMLDELRSWGIPAPVVCAAVGYGESANFRASLERRGLRYLVAVKGSTRARGADPPSVTPGRENGHRPRAPVRSLRALALAVGPRRAVRVAWREGTRGERSSRFLVLGVHPARAVGRRATAGGPPLHRAIVEWPEGAPEPVRYWLSNLPAGTSVERLVQLAGLHWRVEEDRRRLETELGLHDYRGRSLRGWHHHVTLVSLAWGFLILQRRREDVAQPGGPARRLLRPRARRRPLAPELVEPRR